MKSNLKFFKNSKSLTVDRFFNNVLFDKKNGYYSKKNPIGKNGDFVTSPQISNLFSEIIAIWLISAWEILGKPKIFNIVELGPGEGSLVKNILKTFERFPEFDSIKKIYLFEKSQLLIRIQKQKVKSTKVQWIKNFKKINKGPVIFFGNEFFDAIPIKQFKREKNLLLEKHFILDNNYAIKKVFKKASFRDQKIINSYVCLKKLNYIEFPMLGMQNLKKILKKVLRLGGCILFIDYGYLKSNNQDTLQSVKSHGKNFTLKNLGKADITSHVNFGLLTEFFKKNGLKVEKVVTQNFFLKRMGIIERAEMISKKMKFIDKTNLYLRLKRILGERLMGSLFKVICAHNFKNKNFLGFK